MEGKSGMPRLGVDTVVVNVDWEDGDAIDLL
jgi:hypothetical protein